ncbi:hypothetical protein CEXT_5371 [Caerostris extrusa]|uniref:Uncharacterized protein n=1 Tax=Caerostris extrusa TaxID=172846 RepID=A0AAV4S258_CAEEX|nr:hypothetical protein CEXT_5371 [Caerostris extrusa]
MPLKEDGGGVKMKSIFQLKTLMASISLCFRFLSTKREHPTRNVKNPNAMLLKGGGSKKKIAQKGADLEGGMEVKLLRVQTIYHWGGEVGSGGFCAVLSWMKYRWEF